MQLSDLIELAHRQAHREWGQNGARQGLTHSEFEYLSAIKEQEARQVASDDHGQHLHDVVTEMGVKKASASAMVQKLEERGLVERVPCQYDARAQHILLTSDGQALLRRGRQIYRSAAEAILRDWTPEQRTALIAALEKLGPPR